ncbi:hypothetical protein JCM10908_007273 [Rhodotorula pacifica]|uniref:uncharacterized protein n=1 Tax=Rhodotorula pacifica TaxID=1495444 RepID=UPI00317ABE53
MGLGNWARREWTDAKEAAREIWHFTRTHDWKRSARSSFKRKYWLWWFVGIILVVAVVLLAIFRDKIVDKFEPHKEAIVKFPASWVIPIVVLVILSFPPLGGHEIVILVVGLVWGVWKGFAIACAGTFIGEVACYYVFRYFLTDRAAKIESKNIFYACVARMMRHGSLWIIIVVRFSAVPGHVVTAIQSTVGMSIWIYSIAIIVSLPKQLAVVWLGYEFGVNKHTADPAKVHEQKVISLSVFFGTAVATVLALYIVYMRARKLYPEILREMAEADTGSKLSLAEAGAPLGAADELEYGSGGRNSLGRRRSLAEAAWDSTWRPDLEVGNGNEDSPRHLAAASDPWDSTSPAMKRDWAEDEHRIEDVNRGGDRPHETRRLRADSAVGGASDEDTPPYQPLPLRSASEMSAAQRAAADAVAAAAAGAGGRPATNQQQMYGGPVYASQSTRSVDLAGPPGGAYGYEPQAGAQDRYWPSGGGRP